MSPTPWDLEELTLIEHALGALLTNLRVERALAGPAERPELDAFGKRVRALLDELPHRALAVEQRCKTCSGRRWLGVTLDEGKPFSSWRKVACSEC